MAAKSTTAGTPVKSYYYISILLLVYLYYMITCKITRAGRNRISTPFPWFCSQSIIDYSRGRLCFWKYILLLLWWQNDQTAELHNIKNKYRPWGWFENIKKCLEMVLLRPYQNSQKQKWPWHQLQILGNCRSFELPIPTKLELKMAVDLTSPRRSTLLQLHHKSYAL